MKYDLNDFDPGYGDTNSAPFTASADPSLTGYSTPPKSGGVTLTATPGGGGPRRQQNPLARDPAQQSVATPGNTGGEETTPPAAGRAIALWTVFGAISAVALVGTIIWLLPDEPKRRRRKNPSRKPKKKNPGTPHKWAAPAAATHYRYSGPMTACGLPGTFNKSTAATSDVTCKRCRKSKDFKIGQEVGQ